MMISGSGTANCFTQSHRPSSMKSSISLMGEAVDDRIELLDLLGSKRMVEQPAHLLVVGIVATGQRRCGNPTLLLVERG